MAEDEIYEVLKPIPPTANLYVSFLCLGLLQTGRPQEFVTGMTVDTTANTAAGPAIRKAPEPVAVEKTLEEPPKDNGP